MRTLDHTIVEFYNILWKKMYLLKQNIEYKIVLKELELFIQIVDIEKSKNYVERALEISLMEGLPIYDSLFITLAKDKNESLITSDKKQAEIAKKYVNVIYI